MSERTPAALLSLGFLLVGLSLPAQVVFGHTLFSRSGSLMVVFAVLAEFSLLRSRDAHHSSQLIEFAAGRQARLEQIHPSTRHRALEWLAHTTTVLGTVIWGYGDLLWG